MISFSQPYDIQCPACDTPFSKDMWVLIDAQERPDLVEQVKDLTLHDISCPRCAQTGVIAAPLLYHDQSVRKVLFAVPRDMEQAEWQELAQALLWMLIGSLPQEQQLPYLSDVQAEAGLAGLLEALVQQQRMPQTAAEAIGDALGTEESGGLPPLAEAMLAILDAQTPQDFERLFVHYPFLLDESMDEGLAGLADAATEQGEIEVGQAFERARLVLGQIRSKVDQVRANVTQSEASPPTVAVPELPMPPANWRKAVAALLQTEEPGALTEIKHTYPMLTDQYADGWLHEDEQALRDVGDLAGAQLVSEARARLRGERGV